MEGRFINNQEKVHLRFTLTGEPARILIELKERGIVNTYQEAVRHAIYAYKDKIDERDLKSIKINSEQIE